MPQVRWLLLVVIVICPTACRRAEVADVDPTEWEQSPPAVDLTKVDRTIRKEPKYRDKPRYGLLVLGPKAEARIWLVIDGKTLYVDRNGNGDLTEKGERVFAGKMENDPSGEIEEYQAGEIVQADGKTRHSDLVVRQYFARQFNQLVNGVSIGDAIGTIRQGASGENGCSFGPTPKDAPIIHINGPLTLRVHGVVVESRAQSKVYEYSDQLNELVDAFPSDPVAANKVGHRINDVPYKLKAGEKVGTLHVEVGTPGLGKGTFAALGIEKGLPADLHPTVEILLPSRANPRKMIKAEFTLKERC
jgi:hypothetical protein